MKKGQSKVSIVIPNYDRKEHLEILLTSIASQTYHDYEVIIVDDFSTDRSVVEFIKEYIKGRENMRLIENDKNLGFVKTCNKGFRLVGREYVCLLTNDTEIKNNFLERNVEIMDADSSIGVLSCIIVDQNGNNWFSGGSFKAGVRANLKDDFEGVRDVDWVAGTAPFYRREVFDRVGFLSEDFVMYHEDIDFCLRVRNETDYKICMFPEKLVTHSPRLLSQRPNYTKSIRIAYYGNRNHILLLKRYSPENIPKILLYQLKEIVKLPTIQLLKLRFRDFLFSVLLNIPRIAGTIVGLIQMRRKQ